MAGLEFRSAVVDNLIPVTEDYADSNIEAAKKSPPAGIDI
jgi:hypothetical protein